MDELTWPDYEADLDRKIEDLHARVQRGAYWAMPSRRRYIPKPDGQQRPLAVAVLNAIHEEDFLGFSYEFRPKRGAHDALDALMVGISRTKVNTILRGRYPVVLRRSQPVRMVKFLNHRVGDPRLIRLIQKWLRAGVLEDGTVTVSDKGTGHGSVASPLLTNIYLHYVFDLWAERWRRRNAMGDMIVLRHADDIGVGFECKADAQRFWDEMRERLRKFSSSLHPEKTCLIEFGRLAATRRARRGLKKLETFNFPGLHLYLRPQQPGQVPAVQENPARPHAG